MQARMPLIIKSSCFLQKIFTAFKKTLYVIKYECNFSITKYSKGKHQMKPDSNFNLVKEMLETALVLKNFDPSKTKAIAEEVKAAGKLMLTGEGSSRIFPAKNLMYLFQKKGVDIAVNTDGAYQASEYDLSKSAVMVASNSGKTKEAVTLIKKLQAEGHQKIYGVTATANTPIADLPNASIVLSCGPEEAVAATKSVVEQALVYQSVFANIVDCKCVTNNQEKAAVLAEQIMMQEYDAELINKLANARMIFFAGRNDGVAEELTLKTNEITRKRSDYLEGTYALHGIEEVMREDDVIIFIEPWESEFEKMQSIFEKNIGATIIAISSKDTPFPTIKLPELCGYNTYFRLMAGWNLLVQTGIALGVDLDHPTRARKIGNAI